MAASGSINVAAFTAPENRGYLIAGIGGLIAFLSFFILPFYGVSYSGTLGSFSSSVTASSATGPYAVLWLVMLGALVALAVSVLLALGIRAISQLTPQLGARIILGSGVVAALIQILMAIKINGDVNSIAGIGSAVGADVLSKAGFSYGFGFGFWLMLLAFIAVIVGGVMSMRQTQSAPAPAGM